MGGFGNGAGVTRVTNGFSKKWQNLKAAYAPHFCLVGYFAMDSIRVVTANQAALISTSFSPKLRRSSALGSVFVRTCFSVR